MTNARTTRRALLTSIMSLILCCTMLLGTTFAWFTDTVTNEGNVITSGNLDVELYHTNKVDNTEPVGLDTKLFDDIKFWEPGAVVWENFKVANEGTLALRYQLALLFNNASVTEPGGTRTLVDVLKIAVVPGGFNGTREQAEQLAYNYDLKSFALESKLDAGDSDVYGIVICWKPNVVNDNLYNVQGGLSIDLGVNLFATQATVESDSIDNNYDVDAWKDLRPNINGAINVSTVNVNANGSASVEVNEAPSALTSKTTIEASEGSFEPTDKVEVTVDTISKLFDVSATGGVIASLNITMTVNGNAMTTALADGKYFTVTTYIPKNFNANEINVVYTGTDGKAQPTDISYEPETGKLTFKTNHFSNYDVSGKALAYDVETDTALTTVQQVIDAAKQEGNTVVIPEDNKSVIENEIEKMPAAEQEAAKDAIESVKSGKIVGTAAELQEAIDADEPSIIFGADIAGNVTVIQKLGVAITIDGNGYEYDGVIVVNGGSTRPKTAALTIQNVDFVADSIPADVDANIRLGVSGDTSTRYTNNVTVKDCTFSGKGEKIVAVKSYTGGDLNLTLENLTVNEGMHSLAQLKNVEQNLIVTNCVVKSKNGLNVNNGTNLTMDGCTFDVKGYAVRFGESANTTDETFIIKNSTLKSACAEEGDAVVEFRKGAVNATLTMTNTKIIGDVEFKGTTADTKITMDGTFVATSTETLNAAIAAKVAKIYLAKGNYAADLYNIAARDSLTITGQGADTQLAFKNLQVRASQFKELTIDNCEIIRMPEKTWGHLVFGSSTTADGVYTLSNCIFNGVGSQGVYINQDVPATFNIKNCTFNGDFGGEGAITIQDNNVAGLVVNVADCTFTNIPTTSHKIAVLFTSTNEWTLNANGVEVWHRDAQ